jgi:nitrogen fixation NifU-like protein
MSELRDLYQEMVLEHARSPRNHREMTPPCRHAAGHNPLCGDKLDVYVKLDASGARIEDLSFRGQGCAISQASASLMTEALQGKSVPEALALGDAVHELMTQDDATAEGLGKLIVFQGVRAFPLRVKCATLAWHTLRAALETEPSAAPTVSTE